MSDENKEDNVMDKTITLKSLLKPFTLLFGDIERKRELKKQKEDLEYHKQVARIHSGADEPCAHKWKEVDKQKMSRGESTIGTLYTLKCTKCGDITSRKVEV